MRRIVTDESTGEPLNATPGHAYEVVHTMYRVSDDGNDEGDILLITVMPEGVPIPLSTIGIGAVR